MGDRELVFLRVTGRDLLSDWFYSVHCRGQACFTRRAGWVAFARIRAVGPYTGAFCGNCRLGIQIYNQF